MPLMPQESIGQRPEERQKLAMRWQIADGAIVITGMLYPPLSRLQRSISAFQAVNMSWG